MKKRKILALGLSLVLGFGFVSNSYAKDNDESFTEITSKIEGEKELLRAQYSYSNKIDHLNLSFSKGKDYLNKIKDATSVDQVKAIYDKALEESNKNEEKFSGRTLFLMYKKKNNTRWFLRSLEISDDGIVTGNYEKEEMILSEDNYNMIIDHINSATSEKEIREVNEVIYYILKNEGNHFDGDVAIDIWEDEEVDKSFLKKLLDKKYKKEDYTEESYKFYTMIHTASKKVYEDKEASQYEVDKALTNLNTAINLLEKVEKTEENKDVKENSEDKNKPATDKEKPEKNINKKIEEAIHRIEVKLGGLKYIKEAMPETYKRYKDIMDDAIADTEKALKQAKEFLKN